MFNNLERRKWALTDKRVPRYSFLCGILILIVSCNSDRSDLDLTEFTKHVRSSEPYEPNAAIASFTVPPGFEIQLFASEPDIGKPLNMAFDTRGRMWLTQSFEYPFPDTSNAGRDRISILEDTDGDGRADIIQTFADSLNIPIGIVTVPDGAIAYSIPNIYHFKDINGDDVVDERKVLYGEFEYKDTHGMINNLIRSWDGWIHAGHGFANTSTVAGSDGDSIKMFSGNTFRFRPDGSRIEFTTTGRVNPFGYAYDERGYTYSVDCHTSPIYQLIRGADYPHFGKQPSGIGFGPALMSHDYGSTALAGLEYYLGDQFPSEYRNSFFIGDVVKSRVYRSKVSMAGTTPVNKWEEDFIVSSDPWFRPVDVKLGPDGAIYIADFYNRIIGHYEVALDHPGRDRHRGRIWRIVYKQPEATEYHRPDDISQSSLPDLINLLDHPNLPFRMSVADQIVDRVGESAESEVTELLNDPNSSTHSKIQGLWILHRLGKLPLPILDNVLGSEDSLLKLHALRILYDMEEINPQLVEMAHKLLHDPDPHIVRQAVMVVANNPRFVHVPDLLQKLDEVNSTEDTHLFYSLRQSLRDHLRSPGTLLKVVSTQWTDGELSYLANAALGVENEKAASFLAQCIKNKAWTDGELISFVKHSAKYLDEVEFNRMLDGLARQYKGDLQLSGQIFSALEDGLDYSGRSMSGRGRAWALQWIDQALAGFTAESESWLFEPNVHRQVGSNPWRLYQYPYSEDQTVTTLVSGPADGEGYEVSQIRSPEFTIEDDLKFLLIGHKHSEDPGQRQMSPMNSVSLYLSVEDSLIRKSLVENEDHSKEIVWDLQDVVGQKGYLVLLDGSNVRGEFIGIGQIQGVSIKIPTQDPLSVSNHLVRAAELAGRYGPGSIYDSFIPIMESKSSDPFVRVAAGKALMAIDLNQTMENLVNVFEDPDISPVILEHLGRDLVRKEPKNGLKTIISRWPDISYNGQKNLLLSALNHPEGSQTIIGLAEQSQIAVHLLLDRQVRDQIVAKSTDDDRQRFEVLIASAPNFDESRQDSINARIRYFADARPDISTGENIYRTHCFACHSIRDEGGNIGPQLDGIGNWGARALTEKVFDPNRNISSAFITYDLTLTDGSSRTGLFRRKEGQHEVYADSSGEEFSLSSDEIQSKEAIHFTVMPDNFLKTIPIDDYYALLNYLLNET